MLQDLWSQVSYSLEEQEPCLIYGTYHEGREKSHALSLTTTTFSGRGSGQAVSRRPADQFQGCKCVTCPGFRILLAIKRVGA